MNLKKQNGHSVDMTTGNSVQIILRFAFPLVAASVIQQMFSLTDIMILGIYSGNQGLAAVGVSSWPCWFQISVLTNFGQAACLTAAVRFGARNEEELRRVVGNVYFAAMVLAAFMVLVPQMVIVPFLRMQGTPAEIFDDAVAYLRIIFSGTLFLLVYNIVASLLRAVGDSYTSFVAIALSAVVNVVMDVIFVAGFHMGVRGAAAATIMSQALSAIICLYRLQSYPVLKMKKKYLRPDPGIQREYISLCIPMMAQSFVIAAGGTYVQSCVNRIGVVFAAGVSGSGKVFTLVETGAVALASACASFVSQNVGARKFKRIREAIRQIFVVSLLLAAATGVFLRLAGRPILSLFVEGEAIRYGVEYLNVYSFGVLLMYPMYYLRQTVQALGNVKIPLIAAMLQLVVRILTAGGLTKLIGYSGIYYATVAAWAVSIVLIGYVYPRQFKKCRALAGEGEKTGESVSAAVRK